MPLRVAAFASSLFARPYGLHLAGALATIAHATTQYQGTNNRIQTLNQYSMKLENLNTVYFVGIGGIGMSAIARYFNSLGIEVLGYDRVETSLTKTLVAEGISIHYTDDISYIPSALDLVVYTPAVPASHKELTALKASAVPVMKRAEVLGLISKNRKALGIAGTHGKTTTSAILTHLLKTGGIDCTAFLGGIAQNFESNFVKGASDWVVMEADEFDRSFLHLHPEYAVITSMDPDHLDIYGDESAMHDSFYAYANQVKNILWVNENAPFNKPLEQAKLSTYGTKKATVRCENISVEAPFFTFDYIDDRRQIAYHNLKFALPGAHNVQNATAAIAIAVEVGCTEASIRKGLKTFKGIKRRFEHQIRTGATIYIDDYAHHPTELNAAIDAARTLYPNKKLTGAFQPHLYSRTQDFATGFAKALELLDEVILLDIYPARETPIPGVTANLIFDQIQHKNKYLMTKDELIEYTASNQPELFLSLGAGDIGTLVPILKTNLDTNESKPSLT